MTSSLTLPELPPASAAAAAPPPRSVWLVTLYYTHGWDNGGHLRTFAVTREWVRRGAEVHFVAVRFERDDPARTRAYLERLRDEGIITSFDEVVLRHPRLRGKLARGALLPAARDVILGPERRPILRQLERIAQDVRPDAFVLAARHLLFAVPLLGRYAPVTIDWTDSWLLYNARLVRVALERRDWRLLARSAWNALDDGITERHFGRRADRNVFVSPVDAEVLSRYAGATAAVRTVGNGIRDRPSAPSTDRVPGRLIFTGAMDFPPNHHAAMWFIERVLPHIVRQRPDIRFVVAGSKPLPELCSLAGANVEVTGFVEDMRAEIAKSALYVAPLNSGSGFKNKVVEALAAGTNVVGTSLAFEFFPPPLRALFHAADDPEQLARLVIGAVDDAATNDAAVERFWTLARDRYEWENVAGDYATAVALA